MQIKTQQLKQRNKHKTWDRLGGNDMSRIMIDNGTVEVRLNIQQMVTMIGGYSGAGKSYLQTMIDQINHKIQHRTSGLPDRLILIRTGLEVQGLIQEQPEHALIVVDRLENLQTEDIKRLVHEINKCNNTWIIMGRKPLNGLQAEVNFNRFSYKYFKKTTENNKIILQDALM